MFTNNKSKSKDHHNRVTRQRTISTDLVIGLVSSVTVVSLLAISLNFWMLSRKSELENKQKAEEYTAYLQDSLQLPIWNFDEEGINKIGNSFIKNELVVKLVIKDSGGNVLFERVEDEPGLIQNSGPVIYEGQNVGHVEIGLTPRIYMKNNRRLLVSSLIILLFVVAVLIGVTGFLMRIFLKAPLDYLYDRIDRIADGDYDFGIRRYKLKEIEAIISKFNDMAVRVQRREMSLREINIKLQQEIEDRKEAEDALKKSEDRYRTLTNNLNVGIYRNTTGSKGRFIEANPAMVKLFGYDSREELLDVSVADLYQNPDERKGFNEKMIKDGAVMNEEGELRRKDGTPFTGSISAVAVKDETGEVKYFDGIIEDISTRKLAEETLRKYEHIVSTTPDLLSFVDNNYVYQAVNASYLKAHNKKREEIVGHSVAELHGPEVFDSVMKGEIDRCFSGEEINYQAWFDLPGTGRRFMDMVYTPYFDHQGSVSGLVVNSRDITRIKLVEDAMRESESKYRLLIDSLPNVVFKGYKDGSVDFIDDKIERLTGYKKEEFNSRKINWLDIVIEKDKEKIRRTFIAALKTDRSYVREYRIKTKTGDIIWLQEGSRIVCDESGKIEYIAGAFIDVTRHKKLESQLQQLDRFESVGTLAGGIAHDFNNLLMGIQGRTSLMLSDPDSPARHVEHLRGIEAHVKSAADLTRQLLGFAKGGKYEVKPTNLNDLIQNQNRMFGRTRKEITIREKFEKDLWAVEVDQGQIDQVLLNIYVNAWQAMPGGGDLCIQTENTIIDEDYSKPFKAQPGRYVKISITDTGVGMDEATRQRIFDPFFTTREMGRGTGLGLASAYGVINNHNGFIAVYSEKGRGTTFSIYLPASWKEAVKAEERHQELISGTETILLVDDEEMILDVGRGIFERLGYTVLIASSGKTAVETYNQNRNKINAVVLDMIMPEMDGGETYDRLREINPDVRVLLSSGYSINGRATEILERGCSGFIQKPFNMAELSIKIREVLIT